MKKMTAALGLLLALGACGTEQLPPPAPVSKVLPPKISLDVQTVSLTDRSGPQAARSPYNTNHFSPTIAEAIKQWANDRLQANGRAGHAIVVIKDASLTEQALPTKDGFDSWFTRQQAVKYTGRAEVSIEANGRNGFAMAEGTASRVLTLPENPTALEKQDAYFTMLNGLMKDLGQNLEGAMQSHMGHMILSGSPGGLSAPRASAPGAVEQETLAPLTIDRMPQ